MQSFVDGAVQASAQNMAGMVHQRFNVIENHKSEQEKAITELNAKVAELLLRADSGQSDPAIRQELTQLQQDVRRHSGAPPAPTQVPLELRTHAEIGRQGWDCDAATVTMRAKDVLNSVGLVENTDYQNLSAIRDKGSTVELFFKCPVKLSMAKTAVRMKGTRYTDSSGELLKPVWLNVKKTWQEMKPSRILSRVAACIADHEKLNEGGGKAITKESNGKLLKRGGVIIGQIKWGR